MSDVVDDIVAFASKHGDYWEEILEGEQRYDDVLSSDELKAFDAARSHIGEQIYRLLCLCGEALKKRAEADGKSFPMPRFQKEKTKQKRRVQVLRQDTNPGKLYGAFFSLEQEGPGGRILLYASMAVYKEVIDKVKDRLASSSVKFEEWDGYSLYAPGIPLEDKEPFDNIAAQAAEALWGLLKQVG